MRRRVGGEHLLEGTAEQTRGQSSHRGIVDMFADEFGKAAMGQCDAMEVAMRRLSALGTADHSGGWTVAGMMMERSPIPLTSTSSLKKAQVAATVYRKAFLSDHSKPLHQPHSGGSGGNGGNGGRPPKRHQTDQSNPRPEPSKGRKPLHD